MAFFVSVGIDYSMTSPAICVHKGKMWTPKNCRFFFLSKKKKEQIVSGQLFGSAYPNFDNDEARFDFLSQWATDIVEAANPKEVCIEGYAFGGKGKVFHIAENTGLLRHKLWKNRRVIHTLAPTEIKKYATGKGNADKEKMCEAFLKETGIDVRKQLDSSDKSWNPISDIADSYFISKMAFERLVVEGKISDDDA